MMDNSSNDNDEIMPDLTVVVPFVNAMDDLAGCLNALAGTQGAILEVIVVNRLGETLQKRIASEFPHAILVSVPDDMTIPRMRAVAIRKANAPAIGVIEDHVIVPADWARKMLDQLAEGVDAVGGAIENAATLTLTDWAAFLCEYSAILPPLPEGPSDWLPGNNVVYRRAVLEKFDHVIQEGKWENHLHDAIRSSGGELIMRPEITVGHKMHYSFWLYLSQRFLYSRSYAGARLSGAGPGKRFIYGVAAFALPPMMFLRVIRNVMGKKRHQTELRRSIPMLVPFCLSWGLGEVVGYWFGAGNSMEKVR